MTGIVARPGYKVLSLSAAEIIEVFQGIDANGDGKISQADFIKALRQNSDMADKMGLSDLAQQEYDARILFQHDTTKTGVDASKNIGVKEFLSYYVPEETTALNLTLRAPSPAPSSSSSVFKIISQDPPTPREGVSSYTTFATLLPAPDPPPPLVPNDRVGEGGGDDARGAVVGVQGVPGSRTVGTVIPAAGRGYTSEGEEGGISATVVALDRVVALCGQIEVAPSPPVVTPMSASTNAIQTKRAVDHQQMLRFAETAAAALMLVMDALQVQVRRVDGKCSRILTLYPPDALMSTRTGSLERCRNLRAIELPDLIESLKNHHALLMSTEATIKRARSSPSGEDVDNTIAALDETLSLLQHTAIALSGLANSMEGELDECYKRLAAASQDVAQDTQETPGTTLETHKLTKQQPQQSQQPPPTLQQEVDIGKDKKPSRVHAPPSDPSQPSSPSHVERLKRRASLQPGGVVDRGEGVRASSSTKLSPWL
eukprot:Tamp_11563.p1 GENE.Tamp_11563~~Tamp_11563.p1  ORF type:complete len:486 (+),score=45.95 Tamp_11563:187-1644(+)